MSLAPTPEQLSIMDQIPQPEGLRILAYAGTGKTTTLGMAASKIKTPALALAFNKSIVKELSSRFPSNFSIKSLNGLGHGAWLRANPQASIKLEEKKLGKLVSQLAKDRGIELDSDQWDATDSL